ncbi:MAG: Gfo/Idh/MocA family oxidoreductase [Treponema sp.]|jgi:predicted dehydrogenase|nr:Gfo/Idh/MocA family oxidoreductase [Treponema sp.]
MDKVKLGIIGVGNMGSGHTKTVFDGLIPGMELGAVADRLPARREWAQELLPAGFPIFEDGSELIQSGLVDAVLIAVPHYQHPPLAIEAFNAGLHVLCEKPAGVYTKQVREMNKAADESGLVFAMMFNQRTNSYFRKMRELVRGGSLGAIKRTSWIITTWYRTQAYYDSGDWRATWAGEGGGVLLNQCPHNLDLFQWICGMPSRVRAFCHNGKWHDIEVEDDVTAYLEYPNGATGTFITSTADAPGTNRFEITLEWGKLVNEDNTNLTLYRLDRNEREFCRQAALGFGAPGVTVEKIETDGSNEQHTGVLKAFAGRILRGEPLVAEGQEGIQGLSLSNAMHLSSWLDTTVTIPFDEELFLRELDKRRAASRQKEGTGTVFDTGKSFNAK